MRALKRCSIIILIGLAVGFNCSQLHENKESFRFVFMTDIHVQPELDGDEGFKQAIAKVNALNPRPDFVITGGDLVMDVCRQNYERADSLYTLYAEVCKNFKMPVYHGIGNHEHFGLFEISGIRPDHPEYAQKMFRKRLGQGTTYRSFDHKGWHFVLLDDIGIAEDRGYLGYVDQEQLAWLKADLQKLDDDMPVVAVIHIPMASFSIQLQQGATAPVGRHILLNNSNEVFDAFKNNKLRLVLQGHSHIVEEMIFRDLHFITGGSVCGSWWRGPFEGFSEGFVVVDVRGNDFKWHYQTFGWQADTNE